MKINVTKEDIEKSKELHTTNALYCPIEHALMRLGYNRPSVGIGFLQFGGDRYRMPERARKFVLAYDSGKKVKPFQFEPELS